MVEAGRIITSSDIACVPCGSGHLVGFVFENRESGLAAMTELAVLLTELSNPELRRALEQVAMIMKARVAGDRFDPAMQG